MEERRFAIPDPVHVARAPESAHDADIAEAPNAIDRGAAACVLAALPFDLTVRTLNQRELDHRAFVDSARAAAPFVATRVDMSALVIDFTVARVVLRGAPL